MRDGFLILLLFNGSGLLRLQLIVLPLCVCHTLAGIYFSKHKITDPAICFNHIRFTGPFPGRIYFAFDRIFCWFCSIHKIEWYVMHF